MVRCLCGAPLSEVLGSVPSTHMVAHNPCITPVSGDQMPSSEPHELQAHYMVQLYTCGQNTHTGKISKSKSEIKKHIKKKQWLGISSDLRLSQILSHKPREWPPSLVTTRPICRLTPMCTPCAIYLQIPHLLIVSVWLRRSHPASVHFAFFVCTMSLGSPGIW